MKVHHKVCPLRLSDKCEYISTCLISVMPNVLCEVEVQCGEDEKCECLVPCRPLSIGDRRDRGESVMVTAVWPHKYPSCTAGPRPAQVANTGNIVTSR